MTPIEYSRCMYMYTTAKTEMGPGNEAREPSDSSPGFATFDPKTWMKARPI